MPQTDGTVGYETVMENTNTANFNNGISLRTKLKPKLLELQADFPRRIFDENSSIVPYLRVDISRGTTTATPSLGALYIWRNLKLHGLLSLADRNLSLRNRFEYLYINQDFRVHVAMNHGYDISAREWIFAKNRVSVRKDDFEVSLTGEGNDKRIGCPEWFGLGLTWRNKDWVDLSTQVVAPRSNLSRPTDLYFGLQKKLASNFLAKMRFNYFTGVAGYYMYFMPNSNCSLATTLEFSHNGPEGYKGCCGYPFSWGLKVNFNA